MQRTKKQPRWINKAERTMGEERAYVPLFNIYFRDEFTDARAAGALNGTPSSDGHSTRTVVDTENKLSNAGGKMMCAGGKAVPAFGDPRLRYASQTRAPGLAMIASIIPRNAVTGGYLGWSNNQNPSSGDNFACMGLRLTASAAYTLNVWDLSTLFPIGTLTADTPQELAMILQGTGAYFLTRGAGYDANFWTLLYVTNAINSATLYPAFINHNLIVDCEYVDVRQMLSNLWTTANGIKTQSIAATQIGDTIIHESDAQVEFTWTAVAAETLEISLRYQDDNNRWCVRCSQAGSTIKLIQVEGGVETERGSSAQTWTNGASYRVVINIRVRTINAWVNNVAKWTYSTAAYNNGYKIAKVNKIGSNFISWPGNLASLEYPSPVTLLNPSRAYAKNAAAALVTPTYDGSGKAIHPDVIYISGGWGPLIKKYLIAYSPYPGEDSQFENPSFYWSDDGNTWTAPVGLVNPLDPFPGGDYNSDPCLMFEPDNVRLWCIWRRASLPDCLYARSTIDGTTWTTTEQILIGNNTDLLSPTIIHDGAQYIMWTVDATVDPHVLQRRTASAINEVWSAPVNCSIALPAAGALWHQDIILSGGILYGVFLSDTGSMYFATSTDMGLSWSVASSALMSGVGGAWDAGLYRGSIVRTATGFDFWYSGINVPAHDWHIGRTTIGF